MSVEGPARGSIRAALRLAFGLSLLPSLLAAPAAAAPDPAMCRMECGAQFLEPTQNPISVQTCLVRCAARAAALGSANVTAATIMPMPQTPWTIGPGTGRQASAPAPEPGPRTAAQRARERQEAARARRAGARGEATAAAGGTPRSAQAAPAPSLIASIMGAQAAVPAATAAAAGTEGWSGGFGAIHLAPAPSRNYGLVVGAAERLAAHRGAEAACLGAVGVACRTAADFTDRCASVAHALRNRGALVMTDHPSTFIVAGAAVGTGPTREEAERQATRSCARISPGASCRITETRCAG
ncbi:DUF4189 domain-containing protein [Roseomonas sp. KE2513]|uniref:DUF4189 domain-containing protein n=1 Tax=Roseomonas sp. KE2513 TaxID=2479202 RepID=UPI0018DF10E0|nr:DUF4189 domain-containing protein [Roseomonas sp. KE2513]